MSDWKPIDTMPYDEVVLLRWDDGNVAQGFWYDETLEHFKASHALPEALFDDPGAPGKLVPVTHWMPIPALPEEST